jgi:hypothetical protein
MMNAFKISTGILLYNYCCYNLGKVFAVPIMEGKKPVDILLEGLAVHEDDNGCCVSCGYQYCPSLDTCLRSWETYCKDFDFPYNILDKIK